MIIWEDNQQFLQQTLLKNKLKILKKCYLNYNLKSILQGKVIILLNVKYIFQYNKYKNKIDLGTYTRFSSTPAFKNTFQNFQAQQNSAMFQTSIDRFNFRDNHRIQFQIDEKNLKKQYQQGRINRKCQNQTSIANKVQKQIEIEDFKSEQKIKAKGLRQWTYEHRAHLQNNWN
ncbi:hypothetical protein IMG5_194600 [Ichthyophthirius multifiliis]|uniref:Uncharacterized protein n=1 Tax=Ichthyophthirius multifiliis TaxID=5932 RepID=G0R4S3_ICHMU|nr:hypothetical protein IMG5_194600 [Ichthyophthirius multifiliis]EGR27511.1 hypothetical protein IMG5_194600 [Ichthyophthirius multifiliis]|eukprot:XP_004024923.1 hypothetical protein IMG5_194600 [Ichthyophthirius multifiliis]